MSSNPRRMSGHHGSLNAAVPTEKRPYLYSSDSQLKVKEGLRVTPLTGSWSFQILDSPSATMLALNIYTLPFYSLMCKQSDQFVYKVLL